MAWESRYETPLALIFRSEHRLDLQLRVELALLKALADLEIGGVPHEAYTQLKAAVDAHKITVSRVNELEKETHHDIMAMVMALTEQSPDYGGFVHYGATSQDINDTVTALQLKESKFMILDVIDAVRVQLSHLAKEHRDLPCIARTHGQHAIPTTLGFKFANFLYELSVARQYVERSQVDIGKMAGAVGTFASVGTTSVQQAVMQELGLQAPPITTQVVSRLHLAEFVFALGAVSAALERLCKELRNLQRSEIGEVYESFSVGQVGSSAMPQKKNPHKSERVCGLARIVRAQIDPQLETVSLEHERDLTNSCVERITLPTACVLTHYMLQETRGILSGLNVDQEAIRHNLHASNGNQLAERIMMTLTTVLPGGRQAAHALLKQYSHSCEGVSGMINDPQVRPYFPDESQFRALLVPETYIGLAPSIVDDIVKQCGVEPPQLS